MKRHIFFAAAATLALAACGDAGRSTATNDTTGTDTYASGSDTMTDPSMQSTMPSDQTGTLPGDTTTMPPDGTTNDSTTGTTTPP